MSAAEPIQMYILSIDVDDLLTANADFFGESVPLGHRIHVEDDVRVCLDLLDECDAKATFFVNAQYFDDRQGLLEGIVARGHHLGSHGYHHRNIASLSLSEFRDDLLRSLESIRRAQPQILGYRPPAFSMPYDEEHLRILADNGIRYVSSGVGVSRSDAPWTNEPVEVAAGLLHVPISTTYLFGGRVKYPIGYGVTSRLMPEPIYLATVRRWLARRPYFHYYCHSFEIAGLQGSRKTGFSNFSADASTRIYSWRCGDRRRLFRSLLKLARFRSIETNLLGSDGIGTGE